MTPSEKVYVRSDETAVVNTSPFVTMTGGDVVRSLLVGLGAGLVTAGVFYLLNTFIFGAVLCRGAAEGCSNAPLYSAIVAMLVGAIGGLVALARVGIYRPLLVVAAATVSLWGIHSYLPNMTWYVGLVAIALLFALAYALYAWVARVRSFVVALLVTLILVVIVRLVFSM